MKIYIVLTHTGTVLSKIIKKYTKDEFSHVSISLDHKLEDMYSFGRLNPYNPFWGGFIHEYIDKGTFKRFYKTKTKIYSIEINKQQYDKLEKNIMKFKKNKKKFKFNTLGLFAVGFNKKIKRKNYFYCAEFVKHVIEKSNIYAGLPEIIRPDNFKDLIGSKVVYVGYLKDYTYI